MLFTSRVRLLLIPLVALFAVVGAARAAASPLTSVASGTFTTNNATFNSTQMIGGTTIINLTATVAYTGTFNGTSLVRGVLVFHPDGTATFRDIETFVGTVNRVPGTVTWDLKGGSDTSGSYHASAVIIRGTGNLANLHGVLRQVGTVQNRDLQVPTPDSSVLPIRSTPAAHIVAPSWHGPGRCIVCSAEPR